MTTYEASNTFIHALAVGWLMPQSLAKLLRLSNCPVRAAHKRMKITFNTVLT